jgi:DNA repair protein RadD
MPELRPYQVDALAQFDAAVAAGYRAPLLVAPTGGGKTVIAAALIERELARGHRVLLAAPRRELVGQTCDKLEAVGVAHGVLLAGADVRAGLEAPVQVASVDTLVARAIRRTAFELPAFDLVIVDEAHLSVTAVRQRLLSLWPDAIRLGLTATPTRKDGRALGLLYDIIVEPATTASLMAAGFLVPARYFSWPTPNLRGVRTVAGDYNLADLEQVMNTSGLVGDIVAHWQKHASVRRTVVFAVSIAHAVALAEAFRQHGVAAEHVDAGTPAVQRAATFARFRSGETQVLTNCFLVAYGFYSPPLSCVVLARPTKSLMLFLQMLGRGLRIAPGKTDCLVLDHSGAVHQHGFATDPRPWTLEGKRALKPTPPRGRQAQVTECPACHALFAGTTCPECGYVRPVGRIVHAFEGELIEIGEIGAGDDVRARMTFYRELLGYAAERQWKKGAAAHRYRERYGAFPAWSWNALPPLPPTQATRRWIAERISVWLRTQQDPDHDRAC